MNLIYLLIYFFYKLNVFDLLFFNWQNSCFKLRRNNTLRIYQVQCYKNRAIIKYMYVSMYQFCKLYKFANMFLLLLLLLTRVKYKVMHNKNAGGGSIRKLKLKFIIQINFPIPRLQNKLSCSVCKWSVPDLGQRKTEGRLILIRRETVPPPLTRVSIFWKVRVKKFRNSIKRFNQITTLYLKKRVISNRNLISENIHVLEGLLNVSFTAHIPAQHT